ncbi:MAG: ABC transporter permease [Methylococcales bacterium]
MTDKPNSEPPLLSTTAADETGRSVVRLTGQWTLRNLANNPDLTLQIKQIAKNKHITWDLSLIDVLDSSASLMIWQAWDQQIPDTVQIRPEHQALFTRWQSQQLPGLPAGSSLVILLWRFLNQAVLNFLRQCLSLVTLLGQLFLDLIYVLLHPGAVPWAEISITIFEAGVRALGITALVGFLIGIVLSYLSALQLKMFGAEIYIIPILGLSIIRELGPLLAAILVAGRSGSAMTAQIGIMRVTEELDALAALGISHSLRLILPKVLALALVLPLLSMWTNCAALIGGMFAAQNTLDIGYQQFFQKLPQAVPLANVFIGLGKSAVFGLAIALIACHFGFRIKPNTESLGNETTNSVVAAITMVIMLDAVFAILFMNVGMP